MKKGRSNKFLPTQNRRVPKKVMEKVSVPFFMARLREAMNQGERLCTF